MQPQILAWKKQWAGFRLDEIGIDALGLLLVAVSFWGGLELSRFQDRCTPCGILAHTLAILAILRLLRHHYDTRGEEDDEEEEEQVVKEEPKKVEPKEFEQQDTCCICLEDLDRSSKNRHRSSGCCHGGGCADRGKSIRRLECGHEFHRHCIGEWLRTKPVCPLCKDGETKAAGKPLGNPRRSSNHNNTQQAQRSNRPALTTTPAYIPPSRENQIRLTVAALYMMVHKPLFKEDEVENATVPQIPAATRMPEVSSSARLPLLPFPEDVPATVQPVC